MPSPSQPSTHRDAPSSPSPRRGAYARDKDAYTGEIRLLKDLMARQVEYAADRPEVAAALSYIEHHMTGLTIRRELANVDTILPFIRGRVLEWGCYYARDSCIYRTRLGDAVELHGTDIFPPDVFKPFHEYAGIRYQQLTHPYRLDYPDATFDTVTSTGVLEHVPDDENSVREVFRVLKPGGAFAVTFLPNRYSYTEAVQRRLGNQPHDRLYSMRRAQRMLTDAGFRIVDAWYYLMVPTMLNGFPMPVKRAWDRNTDLIWKANVLLERLWPLNRIASNLSLIARKPE